MIGNNNTSNNLNYQNYSVPPRHYYQGSNQFPTQVSNQINLHDNDDLSNLSPNKNLITLKKSKHKKLSFKQLQSNTHNSRKESYNETPLNTEKKNRINILKEIREKKTVKCKCRKSKCMKNYCECFAKGEKCLDCNCEDCENQPFYENSVPSTLRKVISVGQEESSIMTNKVNNLRKSEYGVEKDSFNSVSVNQNSNLNNNASKIINETHGLTGINRRMRNINLNSIGSIPLNRQEKPNKRYSETNTKRNLITELNEVDLVSNYNTTIKKNMNRKISVSSGLHQETATQNSLENNSNTNNNNNFYTDNKKLKEKKIENTDSSKINMHHNHDNVHLHDHDPNRLHSDNKKSEVLFGCNCSKSNCRKKYCECYKAKKPCTDLCRCIECFNDYNAIRKPDRKLLNEVSILEKYIIEQISIQIIKSVLVETRSRYLPPSPFCEIKISNDGSPLIIVDKTIFRIYDVNDIDLILKEAEIEKKKLKSTNEVNVKSENEEDRRFRNYYSENKSDEHSKVVLSKINYIDI
jgi:hypothetical protein